MRKLFLFLFLVCLAITASAIPARRVWRTYTQTDGTQLKLMLIGDEHFHYFITTDSLPVVQRDGAFYYAKASHNNMIASDILAHNIEQRPQAELSAAQDFMNQKSSIMKAASNARSTMLPALIERKPANAYQGEKKGIVILVSFSDLDYAETDPQGAFNDLCNKEGYNVGGERGSVHDYFRDNSYGQFSLKFDVVGPYKAPKPWSYYGKDSNRGHDLNVRELIKFAINSADPDVNFKDYDWDGDGNVDQVYVVYAGYSQAAGADANTIWPHESELGYAYPYYDNRVKVDGVYVNKYACGAELQGTSGTTMDGIGTFCHEFSHCLGLPDFYDISANAGAANYNYGMGIWDVMCMGADFGPVPYTAYERNYAGWLDYQVLDPDKPCKVQKLRPIDHPSQPGEVFQIKTDNENEYYLLECRNYTGKWGRDLIYYGNSTYGGLLVTHVTYDKARWQWNDVNTTDGNYTNSGKSYSYECMSVVTADNSKGMGTFNDMIGDLFGTGNSSITGSTTPGFDLNLTDGTLDVSLTGIKKKGGVLEFVWQNGTDIYNGIEDAVVEMPAEQDNRVFNLAGQQVAPGTKGIVIKNGRKYLNK